MNDLEFAQLISTRIASLYGIAKRSQHQFPAHALIQTRALASLCCDMLYPCDSEWKLGLEVYPIVDKVSGDINFGTIVEGNFPVRSVDIVMQNLEIDEPWKTAVHDYEEIICPGIMRSQATWVVNGQSPSRCLIQLSALNGATFCETLVERSHSGEFVSAARQKTEKTPWEYSIHANFPNHDASRPDLLFKFDMLPMHRIGELSSDQ